MDTNYVHDDAIRRINKVDFDILGNDEIKNISAVKQSQGIDIPDLYENLEAKRKIEQNKSMSFFMILV